MPVEIDSVELAVASGVRCVGFVKILTVRLTGLLLIVAVVAAR